MARFTADYKDRLPKEVGEEIYNEGIILGKSHPSKGSEWICWKYKDNFYISLDFTDFWEAEYEDIKLYNETKA